MSSELAVRVDGLGKCYQIYGRPEDRLKQILWRGRRTFYREFWALRDVSLELPRGATLGIVGRNGSGKSTLLQLLAGTLTPTTGGVDVRGRVAPLLELGTGFNPEFTGRENVFLNAAILGLSQSQTEERFPDIARFADIGEFIDQPVKLYSSGMFVRLAFAVATSVDPDILILDEALSVGDARFQLSCHERIMRMLADGMTLIFVSHDGNAVKRLCERTVVLEAGRMVFDGAPNDALNFYSRLLFDRESPLPRPAVAAANDDVPAAVRAEFLHVGAETTGREYRYGSEKGRVEGLVLLGARGEPSTVFESGEHVIVRFTVHSAEAVARPIFALRIKNEKGLEIYGTNTLFQGQHVEALEAGERVVVEFHQHMNLMPGSYFLSTSFVEAIGDDIAPIDRRYDVLEFRVTPVDRSFGIANLHSRIVVQRGSRAAPALTG